MFFKSTAKDRSKKFDYQVNELGNKLSTLILCYLTMTKPEKEQEGTPVNFMTRKIDAGIAMIIDQIPLHKKHEYVNEFKKLLGL